MKKMTVLLGGLMLYAAMNIGSTANACGSLQGCPDGSELTNATPLSSIVTFGANGANGTGGYYFKHDGTDIQESIAWTHNFVFDPAAYSITKALLTLNYHDDNTGDCSEEAEFDDNNFGLTDDEFTLNFIGNSLFGSRDFHLHVSKNTTHLDFELEAEKGDFFLDSSTLYIEYKYCDAPDSVPVPEPGTILLLGFGMLGMAIYGKRRMNK